MFINSVRWQKLEQIDTEYDLDFIYIIICETDSREDVFNKDSYVVCLEHRCMANKN